MIQPVPQHGTPTLIALQLIDTRAQIRTRNGFDKDSLSELAASIRMHGVLQPVVVTPADADGRHMLVIGERRLLAASMAGLTELPAMITSGTPAELAARQAVENLQREDLHPADVIDGLQALARVHGQWREVARAIGKSPAWVSKRRALARLRPITAQVMREGWTADAEILLTLNQIEKLDPDQAAAIGQQLAGISGGTTTRDAVRLVLLRLNGKRKAAAEEGDEEGDGTGDSGDSPKAAQKERAKLGLSLVMAENLVRYAKVAALHTRSQGEKIEAEATIAILSEFIAKNWTA